MIQQRKAMLDIYEEIPMVYADCKELDDLRSGRSMRLEDIGSFAIDKETWRVIPVYDVSRREFVAETLKSIQKADLSHLNDVVNASRASVGFNSSIDASPIHVLDHDDTAVYVGGTMPVTGNDGIAVFRDSVNATTLINGLKIEAAISRPSIDGGLQLLLTQQQETVAALIRVNASSDSTPASPHFPWTAVGVVAVLIAPIGVLLILVSRTR